MFRFILRQLFFTCILVVASDVFAIEPIRILTYNIRYQNSGDGDDVWDNRKDAVVRTILANDLVGLQEVVANQHDYLEQHTPGWRWYGVGRDDGLRKGEMTSIGWRTDKLVAVEQGTFWLSEHPYRVGQRGWDAALPRIASWVRLVPRSMPSREADSWTPSLVLINVHFDHRGPDARRQSAAQLRRWIAEHKADSEVVLIGDFNSGLGTAPLDELLNPGTTPNAALVDARDRSEIPDAGPNSTWNGFREIADGRRIDHVLFYGKRIAIKDYQTLDPKTSTGRFASDHLPISVKVQLTQ